MRLDRICVVLAAVAMLVHCRSGTRKPAPGVGEGGVPSASGAPGSCSGNIRPPKGACIFESGDGGSPVTCIEFTGDEFTPSLVPQVCGVAGMRYGAQGCPASSLGRCIAQCGQRNEAIHYLYVGTREGAERACGGNSPPGYFVP